MAYTSLLISITSMVEKSIIRAHAPTSDVFLFLNFMTIQTTCIHRSALQKVIYGRDKLFREPYEVFYDTQSDLHVIKGTV